MIRRSSGRCGSGSVKAETTKIKLIDTDVNYAHWIVVGNIVLKILGKQNSLLTVVAFDESLHVSTQRECVTSVQPVGVRFHTSKGLVRTRSMAGFRRANCRWHCLNPAQ